MHFPAHPTTCPNCHTRCHDWQISLNHYNLAYLSTAAAAIARLTNRY